eukprot:TRINITY_DN558_c0_g1_i2.p2 TRINITY_DN558_c0_g1~~TRINITY_DN558_c0_g1_i2.p2  ORF type:complete len:208 (+),score=42.54 TRINITY_DN558_c0_g1_i2:807-1430(+)
MRTNEISWNPMEAMNFTIANEDHNCYTFDMRNFDAARSVHMDHVSAVLSIDYSPTGKQFVTGSYDRSVRIFDESKGRSKEIYHTKRMQKVFSVLYSLDSKYVFSGSDDSNVRIWKSNASEDLGIQSPRQKEQQEYQDKLIERYSDLPEIRRIYKKRHVPKAIKNTQYTKSIIRQSQKRKEENRRKHSKPGSRPLKAERRKHILNIHD